MKFFGILIILLSCSLSYASQKIFNPIYDQDIRDISFEVRSKSIGELLYKKLMLNEQKDLIIKFYWAQNHALEAQLVTDIVLIDKDLLNEILGHFKNKLNNLLFFQFGDNLKNYTKIKSSKNKEEFIDQKGLQKFNKILINYEKDGKIIESFSDHTFEKSKLSYKKYPWAKDYLVVDQLDKNIKDQAQQIKTKTIFSYKKFGEFWFPNYLKIHVEQTLKVPNGIKRNLVRELNDDLTIENVLINKNEALKWYAKRK